MKALLDAVRTAAREDDQAAERLPADAFAPLAAEDRARIVDGILGIRTSDPAVGGRPRDAIPPAAVTSTVGWRRPSRRRSLVVALGPIAAAAAVILGVRSFSRAPMAPLPDYEISASGGVKELRGATAESPSAPAVVAMPQRLTAESRLVAVARPATPVDGPVALRAFLVQGPHVDEVSPQLRIAPSGAVEVRAAVADVFGPRSGRWDLVLLLGRAEALRKLEPATAMTRTPDPSMRRLTVPLDFVGP